MIDFMIVITFILSAFGVMALGEWIYDAHQRGIERVRKYDLRQENKR